MSTNAIAPHSELVIGIQGVRACFHDLAARLYFSGHKITQLECSSFKRLCIALETEKADYCIMAIENSIAGSILPNYSLLEHHGFKILGETYLRIEHSLMVLPEENEKDIHYVQSHPMALAQCEDFLLTLPHAKAIEFTDTAESAQVIAAHKMRGYAAIAHSLAAEVYGLKVLAKSIETNKQNYTRFLILCRNEDYKKPENANKASIRFEVPHETGSLSHVLHIFKDHQMNMTKIQSIPILGKPYQYSFHVDIEWAASADFSKFSYALEKNTLNLVVFGEYCKGEHP